MSRGWRPTGIAAVLQLCALSATRDGPDPRADVTVTIERAVIDEVTMQRLTMEEALAAGRAHLAGDAGARRAPSARCRGQTSAPKDFGEAGTGRYPR
jgi:hypothetical protein